MPDADPFAYLREAVGLSPDNLPLRLHLADGLLAAGQAHAAEQEYRAALALFGTDLRLKTGLAAAFLRQGKTSHAQVVLEELCGRPDAPARALVLFARLLKDAGEPERAARTYRRALAADPTAADPVLTEELAAGPDAVRVPQREDGDADPRSAELERPRLRFTDVGGMEAVKEEIRLKIIHPLTHADLYKAYGKAVGGGILLYGPPGCGKTHLARATAGEIKAGFISIGINDVLDMWIGSSERNLHAIFAQAREHRPCVLFFDEVDALAASRSDLKHSAARQVINQFLSELDGAGSANDGLLILAATNAPWHVDNAFKRPGRFDRILFVPPPDAEARAAILRVLLAGKPCGDIDLNHLARKTADFSGADLKAVIDRAVERKLGEAMRSGRPVPLATADLLASAAQTKPSTREWFASARNFALYANQGGIYDEVLSYLDRR